MAGFDRLCDARHIAEYCEGRLGVLDQFRDILVIAAGRRVGGPVSSGHGQGNQFRRGIVAVPGLGLLAADFRQPREFAREPEFLVGDAVDEVQTDGSGLRLRRRLQRRFHQVVHDAQDTATQFVEQFVCAV